MQVMHCEVGPRDKQRGKDAFALQQERMNLLQVGPDALRGLLAHIGLGTRISWPEGEPMPSPIVIHRFGICSVLLRWCPMPQGGQPPMQGCPAEQRADGDSRSQLWNHPSRKGQEVAGVYVCKAGARLLLGFPAEVFLACICTVRLRCGSE